MIRLPWPAHSSRRTLAALIASAFVAAPAIAETPKPLTPVTSVEGITEYRLANGLQVLLFPDSSKPTLTVNVTYMVGSRHEGRGEAGMAHLLEHMVFKGTDTFENIWGALEDHGARFNGTTWVDRTNYYETLPATPENLEFALTMEADRMVNSRISAEDLSSEFTVVRNEFEMGQNRSDWMLSERMMSSAFLWHNYGKSTIGNQSDIERVPATNLRAFYEKYYQPDNAMLVVAGKFEPKSTLALIRKHFGAIPRPTRQLDQTYTVEPVQDGSRFVTLRRVGDVAAAGLIYHVPAGSHADFPAVAILQGVLTDEPGGRLYKALVESGLASEVDGSAYAWEQPGVIEIQALVRLEQNPRVALDKMVEVTEGLGGFELSDAEVERVKTRRLKNIKLAMTSSGRIGVQLSEWAALGDWRMFFLHRDRLKAVTTADVKRVAQTYLLEANRTAGLFIPTKDPARATIPPAPDVAALVKDYESTEVIEQGEAFAATPENIDNRTVRSEPRPGMKLALLSKETRGDAVRANFQFHIGNEEALVGKRTALEVLPDVLMRGTKTRGYQELRDEIDRLQARIRLTGSLQTFSGSIESDSENIVAAIELLAEILRKPAFSPDEFAIVKKDQLAKAEEQLSDPQARASTALSRAMAPFPKESVFYVGTQEEDVAALKALSVDSLNVLYDGLYGGSNLEVVVVGDFEESKVKQAVVDAFGEWTSPTAYRRLDRPFRKLEAQSVSLITPDKKMAMILSGGAFEMRDDDPQLPALEFASYVLGRGAKSRLLNRLRQKEGLSYGAGAFFQVDERVERGAIGGYAICAAENVHRAQDVMREEFDKWMRDGVTEEELEEGKTSYGLQFENRLADDGYVAGQLMSGLEHDRTMQFRKSVVDRIQKLSTADVKQALDDHISDVAFVEVKAGDLEAAKSDPEGVRN